MQYKNASVIGHVDEEENDEFTEITGFLAIERKHIDYEARRNNRMNPVHLADQSEEVYQKLSPLHFVRFSLSLLSGL